MSERASWAKEDDYKPRHWHVLPDESLALLHRDTSCRFHDRMDAHMLINATKYGPVADAYPDKVDAIASLKKRLDEYKRTGNVELLEDIANFAMIEWMHPRHKKAHYTHDDNGSIGRVGIAGQNQMSNKDLSTIAAG